MKGYKPCRCCALPQQRHFSFAAGLAADRRRRGVHIPGVWLPCPRRAAPGAVTVRYGRAPAENRPGSPAATSRRGERQPLKLTRYRSDVGGMATPHGVTLYSGPRPGAPSEQRGPADLVIVPAPGRQQGRARCKGPPMLTSPHQITSGDTPETPKAVLQNGQKRRKRPPKSPKIREKTALSNRDLSKIIKKYQ